MKMPQLNVTLAAPKTARVEIYDDIGPSWAGMIDTKSVSAALSKLGEVDAIYVHINSRGGSAYDGLGIASVLRDHPAVKIGVVDGIAASAATLPLMVCDTVRIPKNALLMIHDPITFAIGGEAEFKAALSQLAAVKKACVYLYGKKTGKPANEIASLLSAETWYTGDEAVAAGFADQTDAELPADKTPDKTKMSLTFQEARGLPGSAAIPFFQVEREAQLIATNEPAKPADSKPAESVAAAPALTKADMDSATAKGAADERKRVADVLAVCTLARKPELARKYIEEGTSVADVQSALLKAVCDERKPSDDAAPVSMSDDGNAKYRDEYKANPHFAKVGLSLEDYIATRRIDDGVDTLSSKTA